MMTSNQIVFKHHLELNMDLCGNDMQKALVKMAKVSIYVPELNHVLARITTQEKNQVICEMLLLNEEE